MKQIKKVIDTFLTTVLLLACFLTAKADPADELSRLLNNFQAMTANFEQIVYDNKQHPVQKNTGTMALKRPGQFRWETKTPAPQLLITDGNYFWIYDIDLEQATRQKADKTDTNSPASLLSGSIKSLEQRFQVTSLKKSDPHTWFKLVPKNEDDMFQWIELGFHNGRLTTMQLKDKLGSLSTFHFSNVTINPTLTNQIFTFTAPKGVEVIKN